MSRPIASLPHASALLPRLEGRRVAVFLDYDGTLSEIVDRPERAMLEEATREAVERLARATTTAVVSGRDSDDVRQRVAVDGVIYAGSHGFDIRRADGSVVDDSRGRPFLPDLDQAETALRAGLAEVSGAQVDRKRYAIAVHFRRVRDVDVPRVEATVDRVLGGHPTLRKGFGKKVFELRPDVDWHKGKAVLHLLAALDRDSDIMAVYVGDDVTDEDAFAVVAGRGAGVVVRGAEDRLTGADYALANPVEVREFLEQLAAVSERRTG